MKTALLLLLGLFISCAVSIAADKTALSQADKDVDAILAKMGGGSSNAQNMAVNDIRKMGGAAMPRLIYQATTEFVTEKTSASFGGPRESFSRETKAPNPKRFMAIFLLQHVWNDTATAPLVAILKNDPSEDARLLALAALNKNARDSLTSVLPDLVKDKNPELAGIAFEQLELQKPDEKRIMDIIDKQPAWKFLELYLPRYYSAELTPKTLSMLKTGKASNEKTSAIASLISQNANSAEIRKYLSELLKSYDPAVREICAEYFSWHGTDSEIPSLESALKEESDLHAAASISAAVKAIKRRSAPAQDGRNATTVSDALKLLGQTEPFEPLYIVSKEQNETFDKQRESRIKLEGLVFAMPLFVKDDREKTDVKETKAESLVPPIRDYFDPSRKAYGNRLSPTQGIIRLGDTVAMRQTYMTVVSVGDGIAKFAGRSPKMGYTVIIEHVGYDGKKFCSMYSHLSPFIQVRAGEAVSKGAKIGAVGRHFTWENGGFGAHLYFGIYNDSFDSCSNWDTTYMPEEDFAKGTKWVNPQTFIQQRFRK